MDTHRSTEPDPDLDAFLDGQLDAESHGLVEAVLDARPSLRARLAERARVRDLVAGLSRPGSGRDLSAGVLEAINRSRETQRKARRVASFGLSVGACLAAVLLVTVRLTPTAPLAPALEGVAAMRPKPARRPLPAAPIGEAPRPARPSVALLPAARAIPTEVLATEEKRRADRERLNRLLALGPVRRISVVVDILGPANLDALDDAIRRTNLHVPEYARIVLTHEVAQGQGGSGGAVVYALVMDEVEQDQLRRNLGARSLKPSDDSDPPPPEALATLGAVGQIEIREGQPRSSLMEPPLEIASADEIRQPKASVSNQKVVEIGGGTGTGASTGKEPGPAQFPLRSAPGSQDVDLVRAPGGRVATPSDPPVAVYLVWVRERVAGRG